MHKLSYVIPCYRSENTIETVVKSIRDVMRDKKDEYEIILVNDGSPDNVWNVIKELAVREAHITSVNLTRNFGQHAALMAGYKLASGDVIVSMDDDGQTPVEEVYKLIEKLDDGYDVVFARYERVKQNHFRVFGSYMNEKMTEYLISKPKGIKPTSFFTMQSFVVKEMLKYESAYPYIGGLIYRTTQNICNVKVRHHKRIEGRSGYNLKRLFSMWINGFTAFSVKPLRIAMLLGFICSGIGMLYGIEVVIRKLMGANIQAGYSSLLVSVLFVGGVIMILLGMVGEYVGRIYLCINNAPQYVIREIVDSGTVKEELE